MKIHTSHGSPDERPAVMISGASTGIGQAAARILDGSGFRVFAGVLESPDGDQFRSVNGGITPLTLDVTDIDSIRAAAVRVTNALGGRGLHGLINNAGIFVQGPLELLSASRLRRQLELNVIGNFNMTQSFLPLLRHECGRLINVGSVSGRCAAPLEGAYAASKFALEALTDVFRVELRPYGIRVSLIEPGGVATPMLTNSAASLDDLFSNMPPWASEVYGPALPTLRRLTERSLRSAIRPERVVSEIYRALTSSRPKARYLVGWDARLLTLLEALPTGLRDAIFRRVFALRGAPVRAFDGKGRATDGKAEAPVGCD